MYPSIAEYNQLISSFGGNAFKTLSDLSFIPSRTVPFKVYTFGSGAYAVVFKAQNAGKLYAIRCFLTAENENIERYRYITSYLKNVNATWLTEIYLFENEINVTGNPFPVIIMDWVDGLLLNKYVDQIKHNNQLITELQEEIVRVSQSLEENRIGHGDVQCGNVVVTQNNNGKAIIKLIDYDGMYVPALANKRNLERGRTEFQHPKRAMVAFNEKIDRFSFWVILTALEALKYDKTLWLEVMQGGFNTLDNMLFTGGDFNNPSSSKLFNRLSSLNQKTLNFYLNKLYAYSLSNPDDVQKVSLYFENAIPEEIISEPPPKTSAKANFITISSEPSGANIYTPDAVFIGTTPFLLDKSQYLNIGLTIVHLNHIKRLLILEDSSDSCITFPQTSFQNQSVFEPKSNPIQNQPLPKTNKPNKPKRAISEYLWILGAALILLGLIVVIKDYRDEKNNTYSESTYQDNSITSSVDTVAEPIADTTQKNTSNYSSTLIPPADTAVAPSITPDDYENTNTTESYNQTTIAYKDDYGLTAEEKLYAFFIALNNRKCEEAWKYTFVSTWEAKGLIWFCSNAAFGAVTKIMPGEFQTKSQTANEVIISLEYYSEDYYNGNRCYDQSYTLSLMGSSGYKSWTITKVKNNTAPMICNY